MSGFSVQQTLHGYGEGHRLLAGSTSLPSRDARTMLILSDSSGSGGKLPTEGYLTGYPLAESAKYVLARTWPAPEMRRPGCVWTHSVVIDFADVAGLDSASAILGLFSRPEGSFRGTYDRPLSVADSTSPMPAEFAPKIVEGLMAALYGSPNSKVVGGLDAGLNEDIVLQTWMQQWPRLRRSFRFCTFTAADRSTPAEPFDLQLVSSASSIARMRVANLVNPGETPPVPELEPLVEDLLGKDDDGLRDFLRQSAVEVSEGRGAMRPLCTVFAFVRGRTTDTGVAIAALDGLDRSRAATARRRVVRRVARNIETADDGAFRLVVEEIRNDQEFDEQLAKRTGEELWRREPSSFVAALGEPGPLSRATNLALGNLAVDELMQGIARVPAVAPEIAMRREDLLASGDFWSVPGIDVEQIISSSTDRSEKFVSTLMTSGVPVPRSTARQFQASEIIRALESSGREAGRERTEPWLQAIRGRSQELAGALRHRDLRYAPSIFELARATDPDEIPSDGQGDPWFAAAVERVGDLSAEENVYLYAFLLARGLGRQSNGSAALMRLSFAKVHHALAADRMPPDGWRLIRRHLSFVMPWQEWDRCWRVRCAVGEQFVDRHLDTGEFLNLADDPDLWWRLASDVSHMWGGRKYLKQVRRGLNAGGGDPGGWKATTLERIL